MIYCLDVAHLWTQVVTECVALTMNVLSLFIKLVEVLTEAAKLLAPLNNVRNHEGATSITSFRAHVHAFSP